MDKGKCSYDVTTIDDRNPVKPRKLGKHSDKWITLNVGGGLFETQRSTLETITGSLLASPSELQKFYDKPSKQYRFDRNPLLFQYILDFYRHGDNLHFPHSYCGPVIKRELDFWGISDNHIAPCCWNCYIEFSEQENTLLTLGSAFNTIDKLDDRDKGNICLNIIHKIRSHIWYFFEDPKSSVLASFYGLLYILLILGSVMNLALTTHADFRVNSTVDRGDNTSHRNAKALLLDTTNPSPVLYYSELVISCIFGLDLLLRFVTCPSKIRFLKSFLNWVDVTVVASQWAVVAIALRPNYWTDDSLQKAYQYFSLLRICRVLLVVKLARHYTGLRILLLALKASLKEMLLLVIFILLGMIIFSTLIYYAEFAEDEQFPNIPFAFWWAIVTMTTVGYGDVYPITGYGYVVGALCALSGMLATGLPIPIIANNFTEFYNASQLKRRMDERDNKAPDELVVFGKVKSAFRFGGNLVDKVTSKVSETVGEISDVATGTKKNGKSRSNKVDPDDDNSESDSGANNDESVSYLPDNKLPPLKKKSEDQSNDRFENQQGNENVPAFSQNM